jgi:hypothetical protein
MAAAGTDRGSAGDWDGRAAAKMRLAQECAIAHPASTKMNGSIQRAVISPSIRIRTGHGLAPD